MEFDAIVVGSGISGNWTANLMAKQGLKVLILEKDPRPMPKISERIILSSTLAKFPILQKYVTTYIDRIRYHSSNLTDFLDIKSETPLMASIDRSHFELDILNEAIKHGVKIKYNHLVRHVSVEDDGIFVITDSDSYRTSLVIGADSTDSRTAQSLNIQKAQDSANFRLVIIKSIQNPSTQSKTPKNPKKMVEYFINFGKKCHFAWFLPEKDKISIGIYSDFTDFQTLRDLLTEFEKYLVSIKKITKTAPIPSKDKNKSAHIGIVPKNTPLKESRVGVMLCGLAGGFFSPFFLEGTHFSLASATAAAEVAIKMVNSHRDPFKVPDQYNRAWNKSIGKILEFHHKMFNFLYEHPSRWENIIKWGTDNQEIPELFSQIIAGESKYYNRTSRIIFAYYRLHRRYTRTSTKRKS
ncbi:MAG: NAD(P)/FAD-dependent oxidoreductase [Promethearchaeota archaeon]